MAPRDRRAILLLAVGVAVVGLAVVVESRVRRPTSPLPVPSDVPGWTARPAAPDALTEVAAAVHDGRIWVAGGLAVDGRPVRTVLVLDPDRGAWSRGPDLPEPIHHSALVADGDTAFLVGGFVEDGRPSDRVLELQGAGGSVRWVEHRPLPEPRGAGAAAWDGIGRIVYAGGVGPEGVSDTVWGQAEHGWAEIGRLSEAREHLSAASDGRGSVFVLGGRRGGLGGNLPTVDLVTLEGVRHLADVPTPRGGVAAFWLDQRGACLVGGESPGGTHGEVECVALDGSVTRLPDLARPRHGLGAGVVDGQAWVVLGGERPGFFVSDAVEALSLFDGP